ncbi:MAG: pyridoxal phosphate-dependent aminotransferase [Saprospiraceae bacterium]
MPSSSHRGQNVPLSPFRKLVVLAEKVKARGKKVYHLNIGQPDIETPQSAIQALKAKDIPVLEYSPAEGITSYRHKLTHYYNKYHISLSPEEIMITTGASEGIHLALLACLEAGESVLTPEPFYANYNGFAHMAGVKVRPVTSWIEDGFALPDAATIEAHITPDVRAIMICNPNNPTGTFYPKEALEALANIIKKHDIFLIVDEVYREFCYDGQDFTSALNIPGIEDHVIVIDSISKRYSACGARVGALVTRNRSVLDAVSRYAKLRLGAPALGQILGEALLDVDDSYLEKVKAEYNRRRLTVFNRLQQMPGVVSYLPGGAFYCFAKFPVDNADKFCQWLVEDFDYQGATVMLSPGEAFYSTPGLGKDEVRIAYVINVEALEAAMDCLEKGLEAYPGRVAVDQLHLAAAE